MKIFKIVPAILLLILACNIIVCQSNPCPPNIDSDDCNDICQKHENICTLSRSDGSTYQIAPTEIFETNINGHKNVACRCCCAEYQTDCYTPKSRKGYVTYSFSCISSTEGGGGGGGYQPSSGGGDQPSSGGGDDPSDQSNSCENSDACVSCTCNGVKLPDTGANDCSSKASTCAALHPIKCAKGGSINQSCQAPSFVIGTVIFFVVLLGVIIYCIYAGLFFLRKRFMPGSEGIFSGDDSNYRAL